MGAASGTEAACGLHGDQQEIRQVCSYQQTMLHTNCQLSCTALRMKFSKKQDILQARMGLGCSQTKALASDCVTD